MKTIISSILLLLFFASKPSCAEDVGGLTPEMVHKVIQEHDSLLANKDVAGVLRYLASDFEFAAIQKDGAVIRFDREQFAGMLADFQRQGDYRRVRSGEEYHQISETVVRYTSKLSEDIEIDGIIRNFTSVENYRIELRSSGPLITKLTVYEK